MSGVKRVVGIQGLAFALMIWVFFEYKYSLDFFEALYFIRPNVVFGLFVLKLTIKFVEQRSHDIALVRFYQRGFDFIKKIILFVEVVFTDVLQ